MSGGTMDKREDVKQWATSTEAQEVNGQTVGVGKSYKDAYADALNKAGDLLSKTGCSRTYSPT